MSSPKGRNADLTIAYESMKKGQPVKGWPFSSGRGACQSTRHIEVAGSLCNWCPSQDETMNWRLTVGKPPIRLPKVERKPKSPRAKPKPKPRLKPKPTTRLSQIVEILESNGWPMHSREIAKALGDDYPENNIRPLLHDAAKSGRGVVWLGRSYYGLPHWPKSG